MIEFDKDNNRHLISVSIGHWESGCKLDTGAFVICLSRSTLNDMMRRRC